MRQLSTAERATLCTADYQIYGRLLIEGTPVEDIVGVNPLRQATTLADLDELVTSGTFSAKLLAGGQSLSPYLSTGAKLGGQPLFAEERAIAWQVATVAPGVTPTVAHWRKVFEGSFDTVDEDPQASRVTLKCRDKIARLLVTEIENITNNPDGVPMWGFPVTGDAIFVMLESVLDQAWQYAYGSAYPDPFVLLDIPGTTGSSYWQDRTNILQALRDLGVGKNGFDLRGRWDVPGHGQASFVLAYYNPPRPADAPVDYGAASAPSAASATSG